MGPQGVPGGYPGRQLRFCASVGRVVGRVDIRDLYNSVCSQSTENENL